MYSYFSKFINSLNSFFTQDTFISLSMFEVNSYLSLKYAYIVMPLMHACPIMHCHHTLNHAPSHFHLLNYVLSYVPYTYLMPLLIFLLNDYIGSFPLNMFTLLIPLPCPRITGKLPFPYQYLGSYVIVRNLSSIMDHHKIVRLAVAIMSTSVVTYLLCMDPKDPWCWTLRYTGYRPLTCSWGFSWDLQ